MYAAKGRYKEVYLAEINRDISVAMYAHLKDFKVEMPKNYIGTGGRLTSNLDVITGFSALGLMDKSLGLASPLSISDVK